MRINGLQLYCKENVTSGDLVQEICPLSVPQKQLSLFELPENIKLPVSPMVLCTTPQIHFAMVKITDVMQLTFLHNLLNKSKSTVKIPLIPAAVW